MKILKENLGADLIGFGLSNNFFYQTTKVQATKEKKEKLEFIKFVRITVKGTSIK